MKKKKSEYGEHSFLSINSEKEVVFNKQEIISINRDNVQELVKKAQNTVRKRSRICAHSGDQDCLHEMIIALDYNTYIAPHKHHDKSESIHIIYGKVDLVFFEEDGSLKRIIQMGEYDSGLKFYYRMSYPYYHTLLVRSDLLVVHETTNGPFSSKDTDYASWAPYEGDVENVAEFMNKLKQNIKEFGD